MTLWSTIETTAAIFCACLPAISAGVKTALPSMRDTTTHKSFRSTGNIKTAQSEILITRKITVQRLRTRISGIDLSPTFNAWRVLGSALELRSPRSERDNGEDKVNVEMYSPLPGVEPTANNK